MSKENPNGEGQEQEVEVLKAQITELTTKLNNASGELSENRQKKQEIEGERDALKLKLQQLTETKSPEGQESTDDIVKRLLSERDNQTALENRRTAEIRFKESNKDFHPDNDPGGIKFAAVMAEFNSFNTSGARTIEDFITFFGKAKTLAGFQEKAPERTIAPYASSPSSTTSPKAGDGYQLTSKEREIIQRLGWTEEKYIKLKNDKPNYVASLLRNLD